MTLEEKDNHPELNILEMVMRAFDLCLNCSAHHLVIEKDGKEIHRIEISKSSC